MPIPKGFSKPIQVSAKERAFAQVQHWIIDGTLQPGEKLNDAELAEALGMSRTPVREALQLLEMQGFVEMHRGRDTRVTTIEKEDILKVYPPLASLQALAAELAASKILPEQIERLREVNEKFARILGQHQPFQAMELDEQFHNIIVEAAANPYLVSFISNLQMHIRRLKYVFLQQPASAGHESVAEHAAMIEALERGDKDTAAAVMKQNWLRPMEEIYKLI
ncbi:GntR family transcriptional regulator [Paenactinomyces guangxiensis]|uniref:GntR family transcriptional regulator n=1 Tax=Paenactinomyces guangxiensis TaxID=1490290 RepID=A0A7W1WQG1_9BACL|nr:GntR family transcriptional regulator [Paenactinomyces guangxiensis]MBA4494183.1 GntR family transcriptional regulator [Paenactinomyces guangxiensis]MBH8590679.1 GntR family transcriptional regulator [Paenactinomyces guangxiensis]